LKIKELEYYLFLLNFSARVLATLTADVGRILSKLHQVQPNGNINFSTGIRIAHVSYSFYNIFYSMVMNINSIFTIQRFS